jgi:hypothetical protein
MTRIPYVELVERNGYTIATSKAMSKEKQRNKHTASIRQEIMQAQIPVLLGLNEINTIKCHIR